MKTSEPKPKQCCMCPKTFMPRSSFATVCGPVCARRKVNADKASERAKDKARKEAIKTLPQLKREAQIEFNAYIRAKGRRDSLACISCGRTLDWSGNAVDAGHYRSVGAAPHLRYDERNAHAQCKHCNQYKSGNVVDYRIGLIKRIGIEAVEALENDNRTHKWTRQELIEIRATYKAKRKELEDGRE